jgi:hypothetical protein
MMGAVKDGFVGLLVGIGAGVLAGILLRPRQRHPQSELASRGTPFESRGARGGEIGSGLMPDERISLQVKAEVERLGLSMSRLDVTTVDGTVYLRGREPNSEHVETIISLAREVPGVSAVVDEIRRE